MTRETRALPLIMLLAALLAGMVLPGSMLPGAHAAETKVTAEASLKAPDVAPTASTQADATASTPTSTLVAAALAAPSISHDPPAEFATETTQNSALPAKLWQPRKEILVAYLFNGSIG